MKRILSLILVLFMILCAFASCAKEPIQGEKGEKGEKGDKGDKGD